MENNETKQENPSDEVSRGFQARRLHCEAPAKQAYITRLIKPPDWDVVFHGGWGKTLMTPAKSVGADGDGSKYLRARGMDSDGLEPRGVCWGFFCVFFPQPENVFERGRKLMEATVCADAASFLRLKV